VTQVDWREAERVQLARWIDKTEREIAELREQMDRMVQMHPSLKSVPHGPRTRWAHGWEPPEGA
jgi:hypothetical protein